MEGKKLSVTLTANAGMLLSVGGVAVLVDALHETRTDRFSPVPASLSEAVIEGKPPFSRVDAAFVTHLHADHYSRVLMGRFLERHPETRLYLPARHFARQDVMEEDGSADLPHGGVVHWLRTPHAGEAYQNVVHFGLVIEMGGLRIAVPMDGEISREQAERFTAFGAVDVAVLNFPWIALGAGRQLLLSVLRPRATIVCHLPVLAEDTLGYGASTRRAARRAMADEVVRFLSEPGESLVLPL